MTIQTITTLSGNTTGYRYYRIYGVSDVNGPMSDIPFIYEFEFKIADTNSLGFKGLIDNVMIFNRALTGDEITELYNSGNGLEDTTPPIDVGISITADSTSQLTVTATATDPESGLYATPYQFQETSENPGGSSSGWQTSPFADTELSPNTQYIYKVKARNGEGSESDYSDTVSLYTLAPTPTNLTATSTRTSITLTVGALPNATSDSSGYYFSRQGGGNSGWIQTNTWQDTQLNCDTSYTYSVKYRSGDSIETDSILLSTATTPCTYDTDSDNMPDSWELAHELNPNDPDDAAQDADNDGWTNLQEYQMDSDPNNACPAQPSGMFPPNDSVDVSLTPTLEASPYSDAEGDTHLSTEWQIVYPVRDLSLNGAYDTDFADTELVFDDTSTINKQTIQIPLAVLKPETTYYWRVRYSDLGGWSHWSVHIEFTTESLKNFLADNEGIDTTDVITSDTGIIQAYRQNPDNFTNLPSGYLFYNDIFSFRIEDITPGATVEVTFQLDTPFLSYYKWLKYYPYLGEWDNTYADGDNYVSGRETKFVTLKFTDGGTGDIDGLKNGVIVDPNGPAILTGERRRRGGGGEKDYCFIATATYGTPMAGEVRILSRFRDEYLLTNPLGKVFVATYYKVSPPVAKFIGEHPVLKKAVRSALNPIIWVSRELIE